MRHVGVGRGVWHARVDLIAPDDDGSRVSGLADALDAVLDGTHEGRGRGYGVDQGNGVEGQPVLGLTFWVRAGDIGAAAATALDTARRAGSAVGVGPDYYDVALVPHAAVVGPDDDHEMPMPD